MKPNGAVIYRGPSLLDGAPIVAIVTGLADSSANAKTGAMLQTWVMREDVAPHAAVRTGQDESVCGGCGHRPFLGGACYVKAFQGPFSVWKAFHRGRYPAVDLFTLPSIGRDRNVRIGSYGDPAAVPAEVWQQLITRAKMHTGYSHQWQTGAGSAPALRGIVMASADSPAELQLARAMGWRAFRVRLASEPLAERESVCPASEEAGYKTNCATCGACNGALSGRKGSIAIIAHGSLARRFERQRMGV